MLNVTFSVIFKHRDFVICTYIYMYSFGVKNLESGPVIGHISVEFSVIFVPFDWIQGIAFHVKLTNKCCFITDHPVGGYVYRV